MTAEINWYYSELKKQKRRLLEENGLDPDWYNMYWFQSAKNLTPLEKEFAKIDTNLLRIMVAQTIFVN